MTERILDIASMQHADRHAIEQLRIPSLWLMSRAGHALADAVLERLDPKDGAVGLVVGRGNNGGDALMAASVLLAKGIHIHIFLIHREEKLRGDAAACLRALQAQGKHPRLYWHIAEPASPHALQTCAILVDAIFGTGLSRPVTGSEAEWIAAINACSRPVLAVDIASGLDGDTGKPLGCAVQATWSLPLGASLRGQWSKEGHKLSGIMLPAADIGIPTISMGNQRPCWLIDRNWMIQHMPQAKRDAHKGSFGHLWIFAGSMGYTGAPCLACQGAIAAHAGCVSLICPDDIYPLLAGSIMRECMVRPQSMREYSPSWRDGHAILAGPGWGKSQQDMLKELLLSPLPLVLDADALNILAADANLQRILRERQAASVITPHPGEAARLLETATHHVQNDRFAALEALQRKLGCVVVLKGWHTLIDDGKQQGLCPMGSTRLARGGAGDVLAGVCGALLARGMNAWEAAAMAVAVHAHAGEQPGWFGIGELPAVISRTFRD